MTSAGGMRGVVSRITRLSRREWTDFLRAQWALARATWVLRRRRTGDGVAVRHAVPGAGREDGGAGVDVGGPESTNGTTGRDREAAGRDREAVGRARRLALAVDRASRWGPLRPTCLTRAVALHDLLVASGLGGGEIRVGVERDRHGFAAHAWVDFEGTVLGDAPESVARYSTLDGLDVLPRP